MAVERLSITALTLLVARALAHKEAGSTYLQRFYSGTSGGELAM